LPQLKLKPGLTENTVSQSLLEDLELFANFMIKRLGDDYFLYVTRDTRTAVINSANALCGNGDWRVVAGQLLSEQEVNEFHRPFHFRHL
jgi:hypothetical protein